MIEGIPWPAVTAASGGWVLFGLCMYGFITGRWLVSRGETDTLCRQLLERAEKGEKNNDMLIGVTADMTAVGHLQKAALDAAIEDAVRRRAALTAGDGEP
jgi:hypothetical protein